MRRAEGPGGGRLGVVARKEGALTAYSRLYLCPCLWVYTVLPLVLWSGARERGAVGGWEPRERLCSRAEQERAVVPVYKENISWLKPAPHETLWRLCFVL